MTNDVFKGKRGPRGKKKFSYTIEDLCRLFGVSRSGLAKLKIDRGDLESICRMYFKRVYLPSIERFCVLKRESID